MTTTLSCNLGSYGRYRAGAYAHLGSIGVRHVEIRVPADDEVVSTLQALNAHGLSATTLQAPCDASSDAGVEEFGRCLPSVQRMNVPIVFVSVKQGDASRAEAINRVRQMGELAAGAGVVMAVETHPEFAHNAQVALETMRDVDHPNVRLNYDTGNIYFYNQAVDAVAELEKVLPYVAAVHLKDTSGGYHAWNFPALGKGVVDFPAIFAMLNSRGFTGPFTMELEGVEGEQLDEAQQQARVAESVAYLRDRGLVP